MDIKIILDFFEGLPPELATALLAMLPITELRASVPIALGVFHLSIFSAIFWSVLGNMLPVVFIFIFIDPFVAWLSRRSGLVRRVYESWASRTSKIFQKDAAKYGAAIALAIFVGIPLPMTGAWSGVLAAFLFQIPKKIAFVAVLAGVIISAMIVAMVSLGVVKIFF